MPTYAYICSVPDCGQEAEVFAHYDEVYETPKCPTDNSTMRRNYSGERVSVDAAVGSINRDFKSEATRDLFLPNRKDFERQHGFKGERAVDGAIKEWNERHEPQDPKGGKFRPK